MNTKTNDLYKTANYALENFSTLLDYHELQFCFIVFFQIKVHFILYYAMTTEIYVH
jgi:hypothetical protein